MKTLLLTLALVGLVVAEESEDKISKMRYTCEELSYVEYTETSLDSTIVNACKDEISRSTYDLFTGNRIGFISKLDSLRKLPCTPEVKSEMYDVFYDYAKKTVGNIELLKVCNNNKIDSIWTDYMYSNRRQIALLIAIGVEVRNNNVLGLPDSLNYVASEKLVW